MVSDFNALAGTADEVYMHRCLQLAALGAGNTAPNPMVGAVLVHNGVIIGEGYHEQHGGPHAEVNCLNSVKAENRQLIAVSTLYVSLEPCSHHGKTPPCADLILREQIPRVVIGCRDPFPAVDGKGIDKLLRGNVELVFPLLEEATVSLNRRFFTFHQKKRPWVILKWAQSANAKLSGSGGRPIRISNLYSARMLHKWRSEEAAILVGTNTVRVDNPALTTRLWKGKNPMRFTLDKQATLTAPLKIFDGSAPTIILNCLRDDRSGNLAYKKVPDTSPAAILAALHSEHMLSVLVEGGTGIVAVLSGRRHLG